MGAILSTILITAPVAFMLGWLLSKSLFRHMSVTRPNAAARPQPVNQATTATPAATAAPVSTATDTKQAEALKAEIATLREALAENEHRVADLRQQLNTASGAPDKQIRKLQKELAKAQKTAAFSKSRFRHWRDRIRPLAQQFRRQRLIITELRDELRLRAEEAERLEAAQQITAAQVTQAAPPVEQAPQTPSHWDDLQELKGIGPALEKKLYAEGVFRYSQLAEMSRDELHALCRKLGVSKKVMAKNDWIEQARARCDVPASDALPAALSA